MWESNGTPAAPIRMRQGGRVVSSCDGHALNALQGLLEHARSVCARTARVFFAARKVEPRPALNLPRRRRPLPLPVLKQGNQARGK